MVLHELHPRYGTVELIEPVERKVSKRASLFRVSVTQRVVRMRQQGGARHDEDRKRVDVLARRGSSSEART